MKVSVRRSTRRHPVRPRRLSRRVERMLEAAGFGGAELSVGLIGDRAMRRLNREFRGKDRATDVLSFPLFEPEEISALRRRRERPLLGDVVISLDTATRQAREYDATLERELDRLLIHGILHLLGHDHELPDQARRMRREERRLALAIALPWPYDDEEEPKRETPPPRGKPARRETSS